MGGSTKITQCTCSRLSVGLGGGTGIVVAPGCVAESNTIYTNSTAPAYAGMAVQGISNASGTNPQTRLMGEGYAIDNKILGCGGATAADIVCNDGVRYNVNGCWEPNKRCYFQRRKWILRSKLDN